MKYNFILPISLILLIFLGIYFIPWNTINWGVVTFNAESTVTVTGTADSSVANEAITFYANVIQIDDSKDVAVSKVNELSKALAEKIKMFGIPESDIKTQSLNVYQYQEGYGQDMAGKWQAQNSIEIILRDMSRSSELTELIASSEATDFYASSPYVDQSGKEADKLIDAAIENARIKAEQVASSTGKRLGDVISVSEGYSGGYAYPMFSAREASGGGGGMPIEPGSSAVSKSVTVTYELK